MMPTEMTSAQQDEAAVTAVRGGDTERYRELVERHERRVFAVAWSRLGDAALAEEAAQEAFIRAYRRLWLISDGAKFSGWVSAIARRAAINLGLRHRRELNRCERWALAHFDPADAGPSADEPDPLCPPEMLRQTLAELPAAHRECLVLFYLEGKSGAEAAVALGISESALRVRLHRARGVLRERLEARLEGSLARLRPAQTLVPAVMAGVLASSSVKATAGGAFAVGVGTKIISVLGKTFLFAWLMPLFLLIINLPSLVVVSFIVRQERRNFRDADGFRPELHRRFSRSFLWGFPVLFVAFIILNQSVLTTWGIKTHQFILACFVSGVTLISARLLIICRNPYQASMFAYCLIITIGLCSLAFGWIPAGLAQLPIMVATIVLFLFVKQRPMRMDYNLFLRAAQGLLKFSGADELPPANRLNRRELLVFARFLGSRFLVCNFRWETGGLRLRLPPVANRFLTNMAALFLPSISRNCSHILLGWDGTIRAQCGKADAQNLTALQTSGPTNPQELESLVEASVVQAWREFRHGNFAAAERMVGDSPELEVFLVPPTRAKSMRWWRIFIGASVVLMMAAMMLRLLPSAWMARLDGLKPVNVTEAQVQEFLSLVSTNPNPLVAENIGGTKGYTQNSYAWDPTMALLTCLVLPETNRFTPQRRQMLRAAIFYGADPQTQDKSKNLWLGVSQLAKRALLCGWIDWPDLNLAPEDVSREIHQGKFHEIEFKYEYLLVRESAWSWVESTRWDVLRAGEMTLTQLRWLRDVNGLDLVDREKLIAQIVAVQTLSAHPPGNPPIHDWKDVRGLFFTPCYPALQDTYFSVATLEILGGLDRMDREECIRGILRRHQGRGCFTSPSSGNYNEYHIDGSARDTLAAFETLRMLGALERVKDLDRWQFRVASYNSSQPGANGVRTLTWPEIEAWECQRRLEHILGQHRENPAAPVRSLLAP